MYELMNKGWSTMATFINNLDFCRELYKELDFL